ncbi:MAG: hypothetical protein AVDCRST_MAG41-2822, partial [uncultured Corynebacteriales bacterium]
WRGCGRCGARWPGWRSRPAASPWRTRRGPGSARRGGSGRSPSAAPAWSRCRRRSWSDRCGKRSSGPGSTVSPGRCGPSTPSARPNSRTPTRRGSARHPARWSGWSRVTPGCARCWTPSRRRRPGRAGWPRPAPGWRWSGPVAPVAPVAWSSRRPAGTTGRR